LKAFSNDLQIPLALLGTKKAEIVIQSDPQLKSRYPIIELPKWENGESPKENPSPYSRLLMAFERELPLVEPSYLHSKQIRTRIHAISGGVLGNIAKIIRECAIEAVKGGTERITLEIITKLQKGPFPKILNWG